MSEVLSWIAEHPSEVISGAAALFAGAALIFSWRAVRAAERDAAAAERSAVAAEEAKKLAAETVRVDKRRYHDGARPQGLKVVGDQLTNPTGLTYTFRSAMQFGNGQQVAGDAGTLPPHATITVNTADPTLGDARLLRLWLDGTCVCGQPDWPEGHWEVVLEVQSPPFIYSS